MTSPIRTSVQAVTALVALAGLSACSSPGPAAPVWDNSMDMMHCRRIEAVSGPTTTAGGFAAALNEMIAKTKAVGGTDLYLHKDAHDWSTVTGIAYRCGSGPLRNDRVISVKY